jgi:hypothetical protein
MPGPKGPGLRRFAIGRVLSDPPFEVYRAALVVVGLVAAGGWIDAA